MKFNKVAVLAVVLLVGLGLAGASGQAFFPNRVKGTLEVKFLPPAGGMSVQVSIDDQPAGVLPVTVYVLPGVHKFTFTAAGEESKSVNYPVKGDTVVPSLFAAKGFSLTVNTNVPGASLAIDGKAFAGNTTTVSAGAHTLTVTAPGYQALSLPFTQPSAANILNVTLISNTFALTVNTNVPGATLAIDGVSFAGNTTSTTPGNHTLTVSAPGYQALSLPFTQPSAANILNVTLIANTFALTVNTNVAGASLAIDGVPFAGRSTSVTPGNHVLSVSAPGFQTLSLPFVQPSATNVLSVTLVATTFPLTINSNVPTATMAIDSVPVVGNTTSVTAGNHVLTISAPGYQVLSLPFVQPSGPNTLNVTLIASTGTLQINTDRLFPAGTPVKFFVDGKESKTAAIVLAPGNHVVRIVSGNVSLETTLTIGSGQNLALTPSIQWDLR